MLCMIKKNKNLIFLEDLNRPEFSQKVQAERNSFHSAPKLQGSVGAEHPIMRMYDDVVERRLPSNILSQILKRSAGAFFLLSFRNRP